MSCVTGSGLRFGIAALLVLICACSPDPGKEFSFRDESRDREIRYHVFLPDGEGVRYEICHRWKAGAIETRETRFD